MVLEKSLLWWRFEYFLELHNVILGNPNEGLNSTAEKPVVQGPRCMNLSHLICYSSQFKR